MSQMIPVILVRWNGDVMVNKHTKRPVIERFNEKYTITLAGCWEWNKISPTARYGVMYADGKRMLAHRLSYKLFVGELHDGYVIDHKCCNTSCVNPEHLEQVLQVVNVLRHHRQQTQCVRGHEFTEENTYYRGNVRNCRPCNRIRNKEYQLRRKEEK